MGLLFQFFSVLMEKSRDFKTNAGHFSIVCVREQCLVPEKHGAEGLP